MVKAAILTRAGEAPRYGDFREPVAEPGEQVLTVTASALSHFTRARAGGSHYSSSNRDLSAVAGADGVGRTQDGRRVYFVLPEFPFGALAERTRVQSRQCVALPESVDDVTAAGIANPGMSAWAALGDRAHLQRGETVLVNGATGIAGRLAVQIAKYLGASKVIATGRDASALEEARTLGADAIIPFKLGDSFPAGAKDYEYALMEHFAGGVNVVLDYLWGESAAAAIVAAAKAGPEGVPVRFIQAGGASGQDVTLPSAAFRSSAIVLMGSGIKSIPFSGLLAAVKSVLEAVVPADLRIKTKVVPLSEVEQAWNADSGKSRIVFVPR